MRVDWPEGGGNLLEGREWPCLGEESDSVSVGRVCLAVQSSQATRGLRILREKPPCAKS